MKHEKIINICKSFITLLIATLLMISCKDSSVDNPVQSPPEIPPSASMKIDFNNFPNSAALPKEDNKFLLDEILTKENWSLAWTKSIAWKTLVSVGMIIPVAAFNESFNHDPVKTEDGKWMWTYEFTPIGGFNHTASLYANVNLSGVHWEMYISKEDHFSDFLWFSGESNLLTTEGTWTFYHEPKNPIPWIEIEWHRDQSDGIGDIKFTNIVPNGDENGGYIHFGLVNDDVYDAFFEIYNKGKENKISIKWNKTTHEGRISDQLHFGDDEWHCWDASLENIDCP